MQGLWDYAARLETNRAVLGVPGLHCGAFRIAGQFGSSAQAGIPSRGPVPATAGCCQAIPDRVCPVRSPASRRLKISFQKRTERFSS